MIPDSIPGYGPVRRYTGPFDRLGVATRAPMPIRAAIPGRSKIRATIRDAIEASGLRDGGTVSFHHHLRNGDQVLNRVMAEVAAMGLSGLTVAPSSIFPVHAPLLRHIERGVVARIETAYMTGPVADAVSRGALSAPVVMHTHGGRARAIESGALAIDVAFLGAPTADAWGNCNGVDGPSACGTLGYAQVDARSAGCVVAITDRLVRYPASPVDIGQDLVDHVVAIDSLGDRNGIVSGTTRPTDDPVGLAIAHRAADVIEASGLFVDGFSFQTGAGGISLAVAATLAERMRGRGVRGSFASGGITGTIVDMLDAGLFDALFDVQCFDLAAVASYRRNPRHMAMSASTYANPFNRGAVVNQLDAMIIGATEIDVDFDVNVTTGAHGRVMGGSGGHADAAAGARLAIVTTRLVAGGHAKVVDRVTTRTTPGETVDVLVTDDGVAVNPRRADLADRLAAGGVAVVPIEALRDRAAALAAPRAAATTDDRIVAVMEYRDGTVIDVVRRVA